MKMLKEIVEIKTAIENLEKQSKYNNPSYDWWLKHWQDIINKHEKKLLDVCCNGKFIEISSSKIKIKASEYMINENGYHEGYIDYTLTIKPSFQFGYEMNIIGNFGKYQWLKEALYDDWSCFIDEN